MVLISSIIIIIFGNQYLLFNEELFIILGFICLCYIVKNNLGGLVDNELQERKTKILNSYLEFLIKKSKNLDLNISNLRKKITYLLNSCVIQNEFYKHFCDMLDLAKIDVLNDLNNDLESNFIFYFAGLVSNKRKFL